MRILMIGGTRFLGRALVEAALAREHQLTLFHRGLMQCYQRRGDRIEAIATYERLRTLLATRLGSSPSPETQAAYAEFANPS